MTEPVTYTRTTRDGQGRQLQTLVRELRHPTRRWPPITLAGVSHIGHAEYYDRVQHLLDAQALVLYELVSKARAHRPFDPDAVRQATNYTPKQRAALSRLNQQWVAIRLERFQRKHGRYPATLSELVAWLPRGQSRSTMWAAVDGWGRDHLYVNRGDGYELVSLGSDGRPGGDGHAADLRYADEPLTAKELHAKTLFARLAPALGLESQHDHIDTFRPNWVLCDRTEEELVAHAASVEAGKDQSTGTAREKSAFARRMTLRSGDSRADLGTAAMLRAISAASMVMSWSPGLQRAARLLVCEAFDAAMSDEPGGDDATPEHETPESLVDAPETILGFRDRLVIETVRQWIGDLPMPAGVDYGPKPDGTGIPASIGVLYGSMHMPSIERGLRGIGYEASADRWLTAIDVRPEPEASRWDIFGRIAESLAARL